MREKHVQQQPRITQFLLGTIIIRNHLNKRKSKTETTVKHEKQSKTKIISYKYKQFMRGLQTTPILVPITSIWPDLDIENQTKNVFYTSPS